MKDKVITEIQTKMAHTLSIEQLEILQNVIVGVLQGIELVQSACETDQELCNEELL